MGTIFDIDAARLLGVGQIHAGAEWHMDAHSHAYWEFIYYLQGGGWVEFPGVTIHPRPHYLAIYPPGLPHAETADPADPEETIYFSVDVPGIPPRGAHLLVPDAGGEMRWLCAHILAEAQAHGLTPLAHAYTQAFLYLVERAWESGIAVPHDAVDFAAQYLYANYAREINLTELAALVHLSQTHLVHLFTARLGISPMRYLRHVRVENARRLLATTTLSVNEIAARVGFNDPLYFRRTLKRALGCTPTAFRLHAAAQENP